MPTGWPPASSNLAASRFLIFRNWQGRLRAIGVHPEQGATLSEMVIENLLLERRQVEAYTALIRELGEKDLITRELLLGILAETEAHASELADFLKRTSDKR